jgi:hypothetical protein
MAGQQQQQQVQDADDMQGIVTTAWHIYLQK